MTEIMRISSGPEVDGAFDVIFLHGLNGHVLETWQAVKSDNGWPFWLAADCPGAVVWSTDFDAWSVRWKGHAMGLFDRAINVLSALNHHGIGERPLCFITHSMGGLLAKKLVMLARSRDEFRHIEAMAKGFVFIATPHTGASLARLAKALGMLTRPTEATIDLERNAPALRELNDEFRNWSAGAGTANLVLFEKVPMPIVGLVVDESSANPGIAQVSPRGVDADHISISKPKSRNAFVYREVTHFLKQFTIRSATEESEPTAPPAPTAPADPSQSATERGTNVRISGQGRTGKISIDNSQTTYNFANKKDSGEVAIHVDGSSKIALKPGESRTLRVDVYNHGNRPREVELRATGTVPPQVCSFKDKVISLPPGGERSTDLTIRCEARYPPGERELRIIPAAVGAQTLLDPKPARLTVKFIRTEAAEFTAVTTARIGHTDGYTIDALLENRGNVPISGSVRLAQHSWVRPVGVRPESIHELAPEEHVAVCLDVRLAERSMAGRDLELSLLFGSPANRALGRSEAVHVHQPGWLDDARDCVGGVVDWGRQRLEASWRWAGRNSTAKRGYLLAGAAAILAVGMLIGSYGGSGAGASSATERADTTPSSTPTTTAVLGAGFYQPMAPCDPGKFVAFVKTLQDGDDAHTKTALADLAARARWMAQNVEGVPSFEVKASEWNAVCDLARQQHSPNKPGQSSWRVFWIGPVGTEAEAVEICQKLRYDITIKYDCVPRQLA